MTIAPGTRLGPYEIVAPIGAGGMGEVYRARDTRLDRSVAVKILPASMADDAQLRARFDREAKTISQLNHPNICTLHDVGDNFLVMELLEGETLADRIARGPMPMEQVLRHGSEIARGLEGAHRHGITHRDLKPGNVMITRSGAKVLDFGLARGAGEIAVDFGGETVQRPLTAEGTIVGTFQYMAPEQLEGQRADHRTDIFALGAMLYEMATGRRAFDGKTRTSVIAAIVAADPKPIHELQPLTPASFERVVGRCLAKDPEDRWQNAQDVGAELQWIADNLEAETAPMRRGSRPWMIAAIVLALALAGAIAAAVLARRGTAAPPMTLSLAMPPRLLEYFHQATLSPDGETVAFVGYITGARGSLWVRRIDERTPRALAGTDGAAMPFWSPDGKTLGFFSGGKLRRVSLAGGPPQAICDAGWAFGGTWNRDGTIVFGPGFNDPLYVVNAGGGARKQLTRLSTGEEAHRWPHFLPDGEHFVFLGDAPKTEHHNVRLGSLRDGSSTILTQGVTNAVYAEPSTLIFVRGGSLVAQTLDLKRKALTGEPRVLAENIYFNSMNHHFEFSAADNGRLLYRSVSPESQLVWVDRAGRPLETLGDPRRYDVIRLSPDGKKIAFGVNDADGRGDDVWLLDTARKVTTRLTFDPAADSWPVWSPDGSKIAFASQRETLGTPYVVDVGNPAVLQAIASAPGGTSFPYDWSRDGRALLVEYGNRDQTDINVYWFDSKTVKPHIATRFDEYSPVVSPDGTSIAYVSEESGRPEVYVERFPSRAERRQITNGGGMRPRWRADGKELFFLTDLDFRTIDMTTEDAAPQILFRSIASQYEVSADGQRLLLVQPLDDPTKIPLTFVTDWRR